MATLNATSSTIAAITGRSPPMPVTSSAPSTSSTPGSTAAIGWAAPIWRAWAIQVEPAATFDAPDTTNTAPSRMAASRTTVCTTSAAAEPDGEALSGGEHLHAHRAAALDCTGSEAVDRVVVVRGVVVVEGQASGAHLTGEPHRVLDGAVPPVALAGELAGGVLRIVDQQVDTVAELEHAVGDARA